MQSSSTNPMQALPALIAVFMLILGSCASIPQPRQPDGPDSAPVQLTRALNIIGGPDAVSRAGGIGLMLDGRVDLGAMGQGYSPGAVEWAPYREWLAVDPGSDRVVHSLQSAVNPDAVEHYRLIFTGKDRQDFIHLADRFAFSSRGDFSTARARHLRILPHFLITDLLESDPEVTPAGHIAAELDGDTEVALDIDQHSGRPAGFSYTVDVPLKGPIELRWKYSDWQAVAGFGELPGLVEVFLDDRLLRQTRTRAVETGPDAYAAQFRWPADIEPHEVQEAGTPPETIPPPRLREIQPGIHLAVSTRGGFHPLVVEQARGLVVVDAPSGWWEFHQVPATNVVVQTGPGAATANLLSTLEEAFPARPVTDLVLTHHHNDHAGGFQPLAAAGARLVAHPDALEVARSAAGGGAEFESLPVKQEVLLDDPQRPIRLIPVDSNPHAGDMLVVWLPEQKILYQSDLFDPAPPFIFPAEARIPVMRWFVDWLQQSGLGPDRIYAIHGQGRVTEEQLEQIRSLP